MEIKACIFDLDGVIVDTAHFHFVAWRKLARALGSDLSLEQNLDLKGVSRAGSLRRILEWSNLSMEEEEQAKWREVKNNWYLELVAGMTPEDVLPGALEFVRHVQSKNIRVAIGSSSKNTLTILEKVGLSEEFEVVVHGGMVKRGKPDPEIFLLGSELLQLPPSEIIVFEDAVSGVEAALKGGFYAVGIGKKEILGQAHLVLPNLIEQDLDSILHAIAANTIEEAS
jgi:beta-phosphoglucomutase